MNQRVKVDQKEGIAAEIERRRREAGPEAALETGKEVRVKIGRIGETEAERERNDTEVEVDIEVKTGKLVAGEN